jgi:tripeptidyl-peptidase-1
MWGDDPSIFNDITKGNNWCTESGCCPGDGNTNMFGYEAAKGWDPVTGLGTPNYGKMEAWLDSNTN